MQELSSKIEFFNPKLSIVSRMNSSKFLSTVESKVLFLLQYACVLELYFAHKFLAHIREELFMCEHIVPNPISQSDMSPTLFEMQTVPILNESSKMSTKLYIANQYSVSAFSKTERKEDGEDKVTEHLLQFEKIEKELKQIKESISKYTPNEKDLSENPKLAARLETLKGNEMAQMMLLLIQENKAVKKCLNQMIMNEATLTERNNEYYF